MKFFEFDETHSAATLKPVAKLQVNGNTTKKEPPAYRFMTLRKDCIKRW